MNRIETSDGGGVASTLFLTDDDVANLADWPSAVAALADAYAQPISDAMVPPRSMARAEGVWLRSLTAVSPSHRHLGCKLISASPKARKASYLMSLFDQDTMELAALVDANRVTGIRTAATAVVAINALAPDRSLKAAVIGSGFEASNLLDALLAARTISSARVYSPTPASRERFALSFRTSHALDIVVADSLAAALAGADLVLCATRSRDETPSLLGALLEPGMTVVSLGSTLPEQREVDVEVMRRAKVIVADMRDEVAHDTGDAIAATKEGVGLDSKLVSLADVVAGHATGRTSAEDIVLYKSVGSALQDVVIAEMLLDRAREKGYGTVLPVSITPISK